MKFIFLKKKQKNERKDADSTRTLRGFSLGGL